MTKHSKKKSKKTIRVKAAKVESSFEELIQQAQDAINCVQLDDAIRIYQEALTLQPENTMVMDALAEVCIQNGDLETAMVLLQQSVGLSPESNSTKWLNMAQLLVGQESLVAYQRALQILDSEILQADLEKRKELKLTIASAYCSISELYMTDLCYDEQAEQFCEDAIMKTLEFNPQSIEAQQALANLRLCQCRKEDAVCILVQLQPRIAAAISAFRSRNIVDDILGKFDQANSSQDLPSLDIAVSLVKLAMECSSAQHYQLYDLSQDLLEYVLDIDEDNPDLWYLMGINANNRPTCDIETAREAFSTAKLMLDEILQTDSTNQEAILLAKKVDFMLQNIGTPNIHELADLQTADALQSVANALKEEAMQVEWSDDDDS